MKTALKRPPPRAPLSPDIFDQLLSGEFCVPSAHYSEVLIGIAGVCVLQLYLPGMPKVHVEGITSRCFVLVPGLSLVCARTGVRALCALLFELPVV